MLDDIRILCYGLYTFLFFFFSLNRSVINAYDSKCNLAHNLRLALRHGRTWMIYPETIQFLVQPRYIQFLKR